MMFGNEALYCRSKVPVIFSCDLGTLSGVFCYIVILKCISDLYIQASLDRYVCCLCNVAAFTVDAGASGTTSTGLFHDYVQYLIPNVDARFL